MKTTNHLHTAVILSALLVSAACTSEQRILGVKAKLIDRLFNEVNMDEFAMLPLPDHENLSRVCPRWSRQFAQSLQRLNITDTDLNEEDIKALFKIPNSLVVQKIASCSGEGAKEIKHDFMRRYWQYLSKQDEETRNKKLLSLPRSLLLYGHQGNAHMVLSEKEAQNFIKIINKSLGLDAESKELGLNPREHFIKNKEFILEATRVAITINASYVGYAPSWAKVNDRKDIMKLAIDKNALCLKYASDKLKNDVKFVSYAVDKCHRALQFASQRVKADKEVVNAGFTKWGPAILQYAKLDWNKNENWEIAYKVLNSDIDAADAIDTELFGNKEFALFVFNQGEYETFVDFIKLHSTAEVRDAQEIKELLPPN